jgi:hypothetical protein
MSIESWIRSEVLYWISSQAHRTQGKEKAPRQNPKHRYFSFIHVALGPLVPGAILAGADGN